MTKCPECGNELAETIEAIRIPMSGEKNAFLQTIRARVNYMRCVKGCEAEYFRIQMGDNDETLIGIPPEQKTKTPAEINTAEWTIEFLNNQLKEEELKIKELENEITRLKEIVQMKLDIENKYLYNEEKLKEKDSEINRLEIEHNALRDEVMRLEKTIQQKLDYIDELTHKPKQTLPLVNCADCGRPHPIISSSTCPRCSKAICATCVPNHNDHCKNTNGDK